MGIRSEDIFGGQLDFSLVQAGPLKMAPFQNYLGCLKVVGEAVVVAHKMEGKPRGLLLFCGLGSKFAVVFIASDGALPCADESTHIWPSD